MPTSAKSTPQGRRMSADPAHIGAPDLPDLFVPIGKMKTVRPGRDVTVVAYGRMVAVCAKAAEQLAGEGVEAEVIDLRSLHPYDWDAITASVRKTNRVLCVNEDTEITNFGEHLIRRICDELFYELHAPPKLVAGAAIPGIGLADHLETASVPQKDSIKAAISELAAHEP